MASKQPDLFHDEAELLYEEIAGRIRKQTGKEATIEQMTKAVELRGAIIKSLLAQGFVLGGDDE